MKEVHALSQAIFYAVTPRITHHQGASGLVPIVGQHQSRLFASQAIDGHLADAFVVATQSDRLFDEADVLVPPLGGVDARTLPSSGGKVPEAADHGGPTPADGDETHPPLVEPVQFRIRGHLGTEV